MWFCKDEFNGDWEEFDTQEEALKQAKECIGDGSDGWPEEVLDGAVKVGIVLFQSAKTNERDTENPSWDFECDVEMAEVESDFITEHELIKQQLKTAMLLLNESLATPGWHERRDNLTIETKKIWS